MAGIKESVEFLRFSANAIEAGYKSLEDGKITLMDGRHWIGPAMQLPAAFGGLGSMLGELADASQEEKDALKKVFMEEFDLDDNKAEATVEKWVAMILQYVDLLKVIVKT